MSRPGATRQQRRLQGGAGSESKRPTLSVLSFSFVNESLGWEKSRKRRDAATGDCALLDETNEFLKMARAHRILIADDDDMVRMVMRTVLAYEGYQVEEAADGREAIDIFSQKSDELDLVMVDQNMPGLSGTETLARLRQLSPGLKAVVLSGASLEEEASDENVRTRYLLKPFRNEELIEIVGSMFEGNKGDL